MPLVVVGDYSYDPNIVLGRGRYSTVYEGLHSSGQKVAVKKVDWSTINRSKHDNISKKLQQDLAAQKTKRWKSYENTLILLDIQVPLLYFYIAEVMALSKHNYRLQFKLIMIIIYLHSCNY